MDSLVALCLVLSFTYFNLHGYLILIIPWPREQDHVYYTFDFVTALHSVLFFFSGSASPCLSRGLQIFTVCKVDWHGCQSMVLRCLGFKCYPLVIFCTFWGLIFPHQ